MMIRCDYPGCGWQPIAASTEGALDQYADHIFEEHAQVVEVDAEEEIPEGMVNVSTDGGETWESVTPEEALRIHREVHER